MKMNFRQKNKTDTSVLARVSGIIICFVFLTLSLKIFPESTRAFARTILRPATYIQTSLSQGVHTIFYFFSFKTTLITENTELKNNIADLQLKMSDYDALQKENQELKIIRPSATSTTSERVLVRVISKPPQSPFDTLVLDAGSSDGIMVGDRAYISDTMIVGLVTDVTTHTSLVTLFSADGQKTYTDILRTGGSYEIVGMGGANLRLVVPKETDIVWGDVFAYPKKSMSIVGTVYYIDTTSSGSFKTVYIRIPDNVFSKKWILIEK